MIQYVKNIFANGRIIKFSIVGLSGIIVNMGILFILTNYVHIKYFISSIFAIEISILSNFFFNNIWTWQDRDKKSLINRMVQYHIAVGISAIVGNWLILIILTEVFHIYYMISNLIGIAIVSIMNFLLNDLWTFRNNGK